MHEKKKSNSQSNIRHTLIRKKNSVQWNNTSPWMAEKKNKWMNSNDDDDDFYMMNFQFFFAFVYFSVFNLNNYDVNIMNSMM